MKTRIIIYVAFLLAGLILASSCSTHDTIMKRRYMKGYYVSKHERPNSASVRATVSQDREERASQTLSASLEPEKLNDPVLAQRTERSVDPVNVAKTRTSKAEPETFVKKIKRPVLRIDQMLDLKKPLANDSGGLSLFWIVILVILILWAIGFLGGGFGLGNLINLLLVVALVLLILWLLKII